MIQPVRQSGHGLVSIDSVDVPTLTTALLSVPKRARFGQTSPGGLAFFTCGRERVASQLEDAKASRGERY